MGLAVYNQNLAPRARLVMGAVLLTVSFFFGWTVQDIVRQVDGVFNITVAHHGTVTFDAEKVDYSGRVLSDIDVALEDENGEILERYNVPAGWLLSVPEIEGDESPRGSFPVEMDSLLAEAVILRKPLFELAGLGVDWGRLAGLAAFLAAGFVTYLLCNHRKLVGLLDGVEGELGRVSWPKRKQVAESTAVVILCVGFLAAFMGVADILLMMVLRLVGYYGGSAQ